MLEKPPGSMTREVVCAIFNIGKPEASVVIDTPFSLRRIFL